VKATDKIVLMKSGRLKNSLKKPIARLDGEEPHGEGNSIAVPATSTLKELRQLFERYAEEVNRSNLSSASKAIYVDFAACFVRWTYGGFRPGLQSSDRGTRAPFATDESSRLRRNGVTEESKT
jgi:hypothetical protein